MQNLALASKESVIPHRLRNIPKWEKWCIFITPWAQMGKLNTYVKY